MLYLFDSVHDSNNFLNYETKCCYQIIKHDSKPILLLLPEVWKLGLYVSIHIYIYIFDIVETLERDFFWGFPELLNREIPSQKKAL